MEESEWRGELKIAEIQRQHQNLQKKSMEHTKLGQTYTMGYLIGDSMLSSFLVKTGGCTLPTFIFNFPSYFNCLVYFILFYVQVSKRDNIA